MLALMISLFILPGCSQREQLEKEFSAWRTAFLERPSHTITAEITSTMDDGHTEYELRYYRDSEQEAIRVLSPALIADVTARIEDDGSYLSFDGIMLETGTGISETLSPLTALPIFMDFLESGYIKDVWSEREGDYDLAVTELELPDGSRLTLWQDKTDMTPLYAAIRSGSTVEIRIKPIEIS